MGLEYTMLRQEKALVALEEMVSRDGSVIITGRLAGELFPPGEKVGELYVKPVFNLESTENRIRRFCRERGYVAQWQDDGSVMIRQKGA